VVFFKKKLFFLCFGADNDVFSNFASICREINIEKIDKYPAVALAENGLRLYIVSRITTVATIITKKHMKEF
jgi:hypothetical protein